MTTFISPHSRVHITTFLPSTSYTHPIFRLTQVPYSPPPFIPTEPVSTPTTVNLLDILKPALIQSLLYQLRKDVAHYHNHNVIHQGLKPQKLLVDKEDGALKIVDLDLWKAFAIPLKSYTHEIVTLWYRTLEVLLGSTHYSTDVDMWFVECTFAKTVRKQVLFPGDFEFQQQLCIFCLLGTSTEK